jgi:hypothetical protein
MTLLASLYFLALWAPFFNFSLRYQILVGLLYLTEDIIKPSYWKRKWEREMLNGVAKQRNTNDVTRTGTGSAHTTITEVRDKVCVFNSAPRR